MNEDQIIRDMMLNSASEADASVSEDKPTILSLNDTVEVLANRNPEWRQHYFSCQIFIWQSAHFLESHADEVCNEKCPELMPLLVEYRKNNTILGYPLSHMFGTLALQYILPQIEKCDHELFGSSPVQGAYFKIMEKKDDLSQ